MPKKLNLELLTHLEDAEAEVLELAETEAEVLEEEAKVLEELGEHYFKEEKNHVREDNIVKKEETLKKEDANKLN